MRSMKEHTLEEDGTTGGQKPSFPGPFLSCAGKGSLTRNVEPLKEWLWDFRAFGILGAHSMVNSRQCGWSAMTGTCPCQLLAEVLQSLSLLRGLPSLWMAKVLPSVERVLGTPRGPCCGETSCPAPKALQCSQVSAGFMVWRCTRQRGVCACTEGHTLAGLPSEHTSNWPCSPKFVAELRSGCWAVAIVTSRHQLPGMQMGEAQLPFGMPVGDRTECLLSKCFP